MRKFSLFLMLFLLSFTIYAQHVFNEEIDVKVCFTADHTWVSDLGFYLLAPGGDTIEPGNHGVVQLLPSASNWGSEAAHPGWTGIPFSVLGCSEETDENATCQAGNDLVDLCFTSTLPASNPEHTLCVCDAATPLTGDFASVEAWDSVFGYPLIAPWGVAIADCEHIDFGELLAVSILFTLPDGGSVHFNMPGEYHDVMYPISDEHCSLDSATRVYMMPDSVVDLRVDFAQQAPINSMPFYASLNLEGETDIFVPFYTIDSVEILYFQMLADNECEVSYLIHQGDAFANQSFSVIYDLPDNLPEVLDLELAVNWINPNSGASMTFEANHFILGLTMLENSKNPGSNSLQIFPNPATENVQIEFENAGFYKLFAPTGTLIQTGKVNPGLTNVNVNQFSPGQYLLQITTQAHMYQRRFVVR